jgi:two-component system sensor histidine kinase KdpD
VTLDARPPGWQNRIAVDDASALMKLLARSRRAWPWRYGLGAAAVALVTAIDAALLGRLGVANMALLYLVPVVLASAQGGLGPGLATSALAALSFNFFLVPPRFTLRIFDPDHLVTMVLLFAVAVVISELAARLRAAAERATAEAEDSRLLATFGRKLANARSAADVEATLCLQLAATFGARAALLRVEGETVRCAAASDAEPDLPDLDLAAARWADAHGEITGRGQPTMASAEWTFAPLASGGVRFGVAALARADTRPAVPPSRMRLFEGLIVEASQALARHALAAEAAAIEARRESDRLREALLSSVGHDLRTPLTVILGELEAMEGSAAERVRAEARRLDRRIGNLLDMGRIEAGALRPALEPSDLGEAVAGALDDMARELGGLAVTVTLPPDLPLVRADARLLHHIVINLLDNARKYGRGAIAVRAGAEQGGVALEVADNGPGLPPGAEELVFERFRRLQGSDRAGGAGLGLGIVRAFAEAMGASVSAGSGAEGGAVFRLFFPAAAVIRAPLAAE